MAHGNPLILILVVGLGLAFLLGAVANRLKTSLIAGYLVAGVAVGPFTPGFVADQAIALQLAEVGVILLMFGVGLHFSIKDLIAVRAVAVPGALLQIVAALGMGTALGRWLGWTWPASLVFGLSISIASTVVLMRSLQERRLMDSERGHIAIGWLVIQDLLTVLTLVLLPVAAGLAKGGEWAPSGWEVANVLAITLGKVAAFVGLMLIVGRRVIPATLHYVAHTGSRELFRLAVLATALGVAFVASELFGVSFALGAFVAGMVLSESQLSQRAAEETLPLRDAFAVLFFVSVGMLFNPAVLVHDPVPLVCTLAVILLGTPLITIGVVRLLGQPWRTALTLGAGLAQVGEFSFILAALGIGLGLLEERARDLILGASIISIFLNPALFLLLDWGLVRLNGGRRLGRRKAPVEAPRPAPPIREKLPVTTLSGHAVLIGHGRVGRLIADGLLEQGWPLLVAETGDTVVQGLRERGAEVLLGNAADPRLMEAVNLPAARLLLVAIPDAFEAGQIVQQARRINPALPIIARAHFDTEATHLQGYGADVVVMGEREIARTMLAHAGHGEPTADAMALAASGGG